MTTLRTPLAILVGCACFCAAHLTFAPAGAKSPAPLQTHLIHIDGVEPFAPAFVAAGSAHERGIAYGKQYRNAIREFLDQEVYQPFIDHPSSKEDMLKYAVDCAKVAREVCPMVVAECEGIAEGAGISFDEVVLIHLHEEFYHRGKLPYEGHCTAVAVPPSDTGDGHTYVGQTWDWMARLGGKSAVTEWKRSDAPSVLGYGYPGMPFGAGMNSNGIALCWTSADLGTGESPRVGVPSYMLINHLLAQPDVESVVREARRDKHAGWFTFVIADGEGNLVNVEGSPKGVAIEQPTDRLARAYYGTRQMTAASSKSSGKLHPRCAQMYKLLEQSAGKNDRKTLESYFLSPSDGILSWRSASNKSIDIMIYDTTSRKAYLTRGPEFQVEWREFTFK